MKKYKNYIIAFFSTIAVMAILFVSTTYAWFTWVSGETKITGNVASKFEITYTGGQEINGQLLPTEDETGGLFTTVSVNRSSESEYGVLELKLINVVLTQTQFGTCSHAGYTTQSTCQAAGETWTAKTVDWSKVRYMVKYGDDIKAEGNLQSVSDGTLILTQNLPINKKTNVYTVYIWLDSTATNEYMLSTISAKLVATATQSLDPEEELPEPPAFDGTNNRPNLAEGMIPIKYNGTNWVKANATNTSNDWYNYDNKIWANAVMVTEATRAQHLSNPAGTPVPEADILAYLVWIPRYKYQLFNSGNGTSANEQEIKIEFENGTATTGTVSCSTDLYGVETCTNATNGNWYTHPAFTFGDDELTGLWVGKFETTGNATTPTVKPNITSLRNQNQNISTQFATSQKFNSSTYITSGVDAHMMKNIEWGAVAYLTQSKYGRCTDGTCTEVSLNNSSGYFTGRSMGAPSGSGIKTPTTEYMAQGYYTYDGKCATIHANLPAPCNAGSTGQELTDKTVAYSGSTTGNIYGIYDMSGGAYEYTMATEVSTSGVLYTGNSATLNSGFTGTYGTAGEMYTGTPFPEAKYYDKYEYGTSSATQNRGHLGDATREIMKTYGNYTGAWYSDYASFVYSSSSWFIRGGYYNGGASAGPFSFHHGRGSADSFYSFRLSVQSK